MELTTETLEFNSEDVERWAAFLRTQTGSRLIPKLLEGVPSLLSSGDTNAIIGRSGERIGFEKAARDLLALAVPQKEVKTDNAYPDLLDDEAHNDGQKIIT